MINMKTIRTAVVVAAMTLVITGCSSSRKQTDAPFFPSDDAYRAHQQAIDAQVAAGAREDGNLYDCHFTGDAVNSLGRSKLDAMVRGAEVDQVVNVHLAGDGAHDLLVRRMRSVTAYLKDQGLPDEQIAFTEGLNDRTYTPAAMGLRNLEKTDTGGDDSGSSERTDDGRGVGPGLGQALTDMNSK